MSINSLSSQVVSILGNNNSRVPLAIKDITNSAGMSYYSYKEGGKVEGRDKVLDEFGTQAIWLFGIPVFQKIIDKVVYKPLGYNPNIDIRTVASKNKDVFNFALKNAENLKDTKLVNDLNKAKNNLPTFKKLFYGKFAASTALTLGAYLLLTKIKQKYTRDQIFKDFKKQQASQKQIQASVRKNPTFSAFNKDHAPKKKNDISFKGIESFMFNPVKNMLILDAGITSERLLHSRNKHEFGEYALKEAAFLFVMYKAGQCLQDGIEKLSEKLFKKNIELDAKFLASDELKTTMSNGSIMDSINKFKNAQNESEVLDLIYNQQDNVVVKALKKSGILKTTKENNIVSGQHIDTDGAKKVANAMEKLYNQFKNSGETLELFLKKTKGLKLASVGVNIGVSCLAMAWLLPAMIMKYRKGSSGSTNFHVAEDYKKQLEASLK